MIEYEKSIEYKKSKKAYNLNFIKKISDNFINNILIFFVLMVSGFSIYDTYNFNNRQLKESDYLVASKNVVECVKLVKENDVNSDLLINRDCVLDKGEKNIKIFFN